MSGERGDRRRGRLPLAFALMLAGLGCLAALGAGPGAPAAVAESGTPTPISAPSAEPRSGAGVFAQNCSGCHGDRGEGNAKGPFYGPSLAAAAAPSLVTTMVERGRQAPTPAKVQMPAFAGVLTGRQIQAVADYVSGQLADPAARRARVGDGGRIFRLYCSGCHSAAGSGGAIVGGTNAPNIRQYPSAVALAAVILGPANMPVFAGNTLDVPQQTAVALYLEALSTQPSPGGNDLGYIGPVAEGFAAAIALAGLIVFAVWLEWGKGRPRD
jgi:ubiquinol-cytochrome c reductase cytochrome c subunit